MNPSSAWWKTAAQLKSSETRRVLIDSGMQVEAQSLAALQQHQSVTGIQLNPFGEISATSGNIREARRAFDDRLASPGLSDVDRAYTLVTAIRSLSHNPFDSTRMLAALGYLARLDALPATTLQQQFDGHAAIASAHYLAGNGTEVASHLAHALSLFSRITFDERLNWSIRDVFLQWADATSGTPNGRTKIDSMVAQLRPLHEGGDPARMADSWRYRYRCITMKEAFARAVNLSRYLGAPMPPITAQFWLNTAMPPTPSAVIQGAQIKTLDDGVIRVLELGHFGCPGCLMALPMMQRLHQSLPKNVQVWMVSDEGLIWGTKRTTAQEQVQYLSEYYSQRGYEFPFAIFIGPRDVDDPDLGRIQRANPTGLPLGGWPYFVVTDGRGVIRHIGFDDSEEVLRATVAYLVAEAARAH